jgi:hypothetical protein
MNEDLWRTSSDDELDELDNRGFESAPTISEIQEEILKDWCPAHQQPKSECCGKPPVVIRERILEDKPHQCFCCPVEVRGLYAVAYNLLNLYKSGDEDRIRRKLHEKMQELQDSVDQLQPHIDKHFDSVDIVKGGPYKWIV